mgnify:CR=1 FL=1
MAKKKKKVRIAFRKNRQKKPRPQNLDPTVLDLEQEVGVGRGRTVREWQHQRHRVVRRQRNADEQRADDEDVEGFAAQLAEGIDADDAADASALRALQIGEGVIQAATCPGRSKASRPRYATPRCWRSNT